MAQGHCAHRVALRIGRDRATGLQDRQAARAPGRFGFACYGFDTPEQDYLPMHCPEPGFRGTSAEGYPATLYCCDFQ